MIILSDYIPEDPFNKENCIGCFFHGRFEDRFVCDNNKALPFIVENKKCGVRCEYDPYAEVVLGEKQE